MSFAERAILCILFLFLKCRDYGRLLKTLVILFFVWVVAVKQVKSVKMQHKWQM